VVDVRDNRHVTNVGRKVHASAELIYSEVNLIGVREEGGGKKEEVGFSNHWLRIFCVSRRG